jgi:hypothetical protein
MSVVLWIVHVQSMVDHSHKKIVLAPGIEWIHMTVYSHKTADLDLEKDEFESNLDVKKRLKVSTEAKVVPDPGRVLRCWKVPAVPT